MYKSQLQVVQQALDYLKTISVKDYCQVLSPHFSGCAGAHMRHILDHYLALITGSKKGEINYNKRNRYSEVENNPQSAVAQWQEVINWLKGIQPEEMMRKVQVTCEVSLTDCTSETTLSSLGRELIFVSSHAIHHFSMMAVMRSLQGATVPENFGVAPATITHRRLQA